MTRRWMCARAVVGIVFYLHIILASAQQAQQQQRRPATVVVDVNVNNLPMRVTMGTSDDPKLAAQGLCHQAFPMQTAESKDGVSNGMDDDIEQQRAQCTVSLTPLLARKLAGDSTPLVGGTVPVELHLPLGTVTLRLQADSDTAASARGTCEAGMPEDTDDLSMELCVSRVAAHVHNVLRHSFPQLQSSMRAHRVAYASLPLGRNMSLHVGIHEGDIPASYAVQGCRSVFNTTAEFDECVGRATNKIADVVRMTREAQFGPEVARLSLSLPNDRAGMLVLHTDRTAAQSIQAFAEAQQVDIRALAAVQTEVTNLLRASAFAAAHRYCAAHGLSSQSGPCLDVHASLAAVGSDSLRTAGERYGLSQLVKQLAPCNILVWGVSSDSVAWDSMNRGGVTTFVEDVYDSFDPAGMDVDMIERRYPQLHVVRHAIEHVYSSSAILTADDMHGAWLRFANGSSLLSSPVAPAPPKNAESPTEQERQLQLAFEHARQEYAADMLVRDCADLGVEPADSACPLIVHDPAIMSTPWDLIIIDGPASLRRDATKRLAAMYTSSLLSRHSRNEVTHIVVQSLSRDMFNAWHTLCLPAATGGDLARFEVRAGDFSLCAGPHPGDEST